MISKNSEKLSQNESKAESASEKLKHPEELSGGIENYLSKFKQLKDTSQADTNEALRMINSEEANLSSVFPEEQLAAVEKINSLDAQKINALATSENAIKESASGAVYEDLTWSNVDDSNVDSHADLRIMLRQEKLSLKNRELKTLATVAYDKIKEHANSLGVEINASPQDKVRIKNDGSNYIGRYSFESDNIEVKSNSVKVIIHEELHFITAEDNRSEKKNMGDNRAAKTGFHSVWKSHETEGQNRDLLRSLNEAVTQKMTTEIFQKNKETIISDAIKIDPEIAQINDKLVEQEKALALADAQKDLPYKYKQQQENVFFQEDPMNKESFEELAAKEQRLIESKFQAEIFNVRSKEILDDPEGYINEVRVLDAMLEKLAQSRAGQENISLDVARKDEWRDMQKAYLKGETIYLRRVEKIIAPGILREFNEINPGNIKKDEETTEEYKKKINNLIERINQAV